MTFKEQKVKELIEKYNLYDSIQTALEEMFDFAIDLAAENAEEFIGAGDKNVNKQSILQLKTKEI